MKEIDDDLRVDNPIDSELCKKDDVEKPFVVQISRPFFTSLEISYLHSFTIPITKKIPYNQKKQKISQFIFQIIKILKFPLRVYNSTMNYYQRFYLFNLFEDFDSRKIDLKRIKVENCDIISKLENDPFVVVLSCLFLATKNEDCIKKLRDIQIVANTLRESDINTSTNINGSKNEINGVMKSENDTLGFNSQNYNTDSAGNGILSSSTSLFLEVQKKAIVSLEFKLLQTIKFDFIKSCIIDSIDQLVVQLSKELSINYKVTLYSWLMSFDIMSTQICLMVPQHCIALALIIISLNINPIEIFTEYETDISNDNNFPNSSNKSNDDQINKILENIDGYMISKCPETLVNEAIIYVLDYYVHQIKNSILRHYMPEIDPKTGKDQVFKMMELKLRFNDLKLIDQTSCCHIKSLKEDEYLNMWDYSIGSKGSARFMMNNKRKRFNSEIKVIRTS